MAFGRETAFLADLLQSIADRSRRLLGRAGAEPGEGDLAAEFAGRLIASSGEASGIALARRLVEAWEAMGPDARRAWFRTLADRFGPNPALLKAAVDAWLAAPSPRSTAELHAAAEPLRQELFRRINLAPGGTATLVAMRAALLDELDGHPELDGVDADFVHLLSSWFNRGFLMLRRVDWSSPADVLEKIIRYEAVHRIAGWEDLRLRLAPPDRRCFAFFHPQMPDEPLIFVEVALTRGIPASIDALLSEEREALSVDDADTAVFYSISNTQGGLKGISFGSFLIKQVVEELAREAPGLKTFVTLSPLPRFARWLDEARRDPSGPIDRIEGSDRLANIDHDGWHLDDNVREAVGPALMRAAAVYLVSAKGRGGKPLDSVARFHLGNGALLDRINVFADLSPKGLQQSHGVMVNYRYDQSSIEKNHEAYANDGRIVASPAVRRLAALRRRGEAQKPDSVNEDGKDRLAS